MKIKTTTKKQTHRCREQASGYQGERVCGKGQSRGRELRTTN